MKTSYRDYFLFALGINLPIKIDELVALKVKDVKARKDDILVINNRYEFPIIMELREVINKYIEDMNDDDYLFQSKKNNKEHIGSDRAYIIISNAGNKIGITNIGGITLRKTFGYFYYKKTKDITFLKQLFNHPSNGYTYKFIGIDNDYVRSELEFL